MTLPLKLRAKGYRMSLCYGYGCGYGGWGGYYGGYGGYYGGYPYGGYPYGGYPYGGYYGGGYYPYVYGHNRRYRML